MPDDHIAGTLVPYLAASTPAQGQIFAPDRRVLPAR